MDAEQAWTSIKHKKSEYHTLDDAWVSPPKKPLVLTSSGFFGLNGLFKSVFESAFITLWLDRLPFALFLHHAVLRQFFSHHRQCVTLHVLRRGGLACHVQAGVLFYLHRVSQNNAGS